MSTAKIEYVGSLAKVRMPDGCDYLTDKDAKTPEARLKTVLRGQPIKASEDAARGLCASKLWKRVEKDGAKGGKK